MTEIVRNSSEAAAYLRRVWLLRSQYRSAAQESEELVVLALNDTLNVAAFWVVVAGRHRRIDVSLPALLEQCARWSRHHLIIAHSHHHSAMPSRADRKFTRVANIALSARGLHLLDHLVITYWNHYSFRDARALGSGVGRGLLR